MATDDLCVSLEETHISTTEDQTKLCTMCNTLQPLCEFRKCKDGLYGVGRRCKACWKIWYKTRLEDSEYKATLAKQRADNHVKNKVKYNERHKLTFQQNKAQIYERRKLYYKNNPDKAFAEWHRQHVRNALKSGKDAPDLLGCTSQHLHEWFEFHFSIDVDFSFENHGSVWHIDHVIPINKWDLHDEEHKKLCFNWKNLMPLRCSDNISKSDTVDMDQVEEQNRRLELFSKITGEEYDKTPIHIILVAKPTIAGSPLEP